MCSPNTASSPWSSSPRSIRRRRLAPARCRSPSSRSNRVSRRRTSPLSASRTFSATGSCATRNGAGARKMCSRKRDVAGTEAHVLLVDDIQFGEHVEAVGDDVAVVEAVGALVEVYVIADLAVAAFDPRGHVVADGVVPADADILVAGVDLEGGSTAGADHHGHGHGQRAHPVSGVSRLSPLGHSLFSLSLPDDLVPGH